MGGHSHTAEGHHHLGPDAREGNRKRLLVTLALASVFMVVEFVGGLLTGSLALLADAGHMLSDVAALALSLFAFWMAKRPASARRTFGFYRTEILAALLNGATLIAIAILILKEAYERLAAPPQIQGAAMMGIAVAGLAVNLVGLVVLRGGQSSSLNVKGAYLHVMTDALGSVGAILAGAAVWLLDWNWADPVVSAVIALLVIWSSWDLIRQSVAVLMEGTPGGIDVDEVQQAMTAVPGVAEVHDLHVWSITSGMNSLSAHAVIEEFDPPHWASVLKEIRRVVHDRFGIDHVTIQIEPRNFRESRSSF